MLRSISRENFILLAILIVGAFFRFYQLDQIPPGFHYDQAFYVFDVLRLLQGQFAIFFAAPGGSEPLFLYLAMPGIALFGPDSPLGLKLTSAVIGLLTLLALYAFVRVLFRSALVALLATCIATITPWHIFFSRDGERVTTLLPFALFALLFFWRAIDQRHTRDFVFAGIFSGLALYTYLTSRLLPVVLLLFALSVIWQDRANWRVYARGTCITLIVASIIFAPLAAYFFLHPDSFFAHTLQVSIFDPRANPGDIGVVMLDNAIKILGMFFVKGDLASIRNVPGRPIFDPWMGGLFFVGVLLLAYALFSQRVSQVDRRRAALLSIWLGLSLAVSLFSDDEPNFVRTLPVMPAIMILPAWGASKIWNTLRAPASRRIVATAFAMMLLASTALTYRDYFVTFANLPELYYTFDVDKLDVFHWIKQNESTSTIFLAPLWYQQGTISLLTRNLRLKSFESRDTIVLPDSTNNDALYAFPPEQERKIETLSTRLGSLGKREDLNTPGGGKLLLVYRIASSNLSGALSRGGTFLQPLKTERVVWGDQIELRGYRIETEGAGARNIFTTLFFRSTKKIDADYNFSVKVRDEKKRVWGQEDKFAGDNSYPTSLWDAGDTVIERFNPALNPCAPAGDYHVTVEIYNPQTNQTLGLSDRDGNMFMLSPLRADASQSNRIEDLEPEQLLDADGATRLPALLGITLAPSQVRAGESISLSLFWRGQGEGHVQNALLYLRDASANRFPIAERLVLLPIQGRGVCTQIDFVAPGDIAPGNAVIFVNDIKIATFQVIR